MQARLDVEARLAEEAAALEAERLRLKEMEEIRAMLERLLEEERQAKRDEEVVRNLQARLVMYLWPVIWLRSWFSDYSTF